MSASSTVRGRRTHRKSRNGCQQCKHRKVKCGEEKPTCDNCMRHGVRCSFAVSTRMAETASSLTEATSASSRNSTPNSSGRRSPPVEFPDDTATSRLPQPPSSTGTSDLAIADLELLHHYTTSTAYTFSANPTLQTLWRVEVPKVGFTAPYTLRAILALSALHLASLRPGQQKDHYLGLASTHHDAALRLATPAIAQLTPTNATPLFLFSALSSFICCAKPLKLGNFLLWEGHEIANWLLLIKGTGTIVAVAEDTLKNGPLGLLFSVHRRPRAHDFDDAAATQHAFLEDLRRFILSEPHDDPHAKAIYSEAIDHMSHCFTLCHEKGWRLETADVFMWLLRVPHDFLLALKEYQPPAMVIVGYFCVLMHQLEWIWCMRGWGTHILSQIYEQVPGPVYRAWLQWPMEQIGVLSGR
ncbi:Zn(II)2Cys6 transcription factor [Aspergillus aculeatinus CBS 121060]|uniref:Uncharacterized protein n=1 Tax=Aspergillus aculeatinus CBS 121060 TaxID=1448322 RepID=A0ACD1H888_9EURO|nr:hypothetical protein BO66DRAFT_96188 [Aspergillus aculeatinus CBS 121060]RAH69772.1 hypothetical protein BO66DRAFT_96188 [Aspergillus aculeatinus CBS 121060]